MDMQQELVGKRCQSYQLKERLLRGDGRTSELIGVGTTARSPPNTAMPGHRDAAAWEA